MLQKAAVSDFKNFQVLHTVRSKVRRVLLRGTRLVFLSNKQVIKGKFHVKARCPALAFCNDAMRPWRRELPDLSPLRVLQGLQAESLRFLITEAHIHTPCVTTRQPTQILPTGKQNNACEWNAVDGAPKKVWIRQIATQPEGIKFLFLFQQNPIKPSELPGKCVISSLSLN